MARILFGGGYVAGAGDVADGKRWVCSPSDKDQEGGNEERSSGKRDHNPGCERFTSVYLLHWVHEGAKKKTEEAGRKEKKEKGGRRR